MIAGIALPVWFSCSLVASETIKRCGRAAQHNSIPKPILSACTLLMLAGVQVGRLFFANLSSALSFFYPEMEGVSENDVAEHMMRAVVGNVDRGVDL